MPASCEFYRGRQPVTSSAIMLMLAKKKCLEEVRTNVELAMHQLDEVSKKWKFRSIFIIIPDKVQVNPDQLRSKVTNWGVNVEDLDTRMPDKVIAEALSAHGVPYFDLADCVQGNDQLYYKIDGHLTPAGHRAVTQCLSGKLDAEIAKQLAK